MRWLHRLLALEQAVAGRGLLVRRLYAKLLIERQRAERAEALLREARDDT